MRVESLYKFKSVLAVILIAVIFVGCKNMQLTTRHLEDDELLLKSNQIEIHENDELDEDEIATYIRQKPNKSILFGAWKLNLQWKNLLRSKNSSKPRQAVVMDTTLTEKSVKQLEIFLKNKGYYNGQVTARYKRTNVFWLPFLSTKKARVYYDIYPNEPIRVDSIITEIKQPELLKRHIMYSDQSAINKGEILKIETLQEERERIANVFQNNGFYEFTSNQVYFDIDTTLGDYKCAVVTKVKNFTKDQPNYTQYLIHDIYVKIDNNPFGSKNYTDTIEQDGIYFLSNGPSAFHPEPISRGIFIRKDRFYSIDEYNTTFRQLANLQMFKLVKINYHKTSEDELNNLLNVEIILVPNKKQSLSLEAMATFRISFGGNGQITYSRKNPFHKSEILEFNLAAGAEAIKKSTENKTIYGMNFGPKLSIQFPRFFMLPNLTNRLKKNYFPTSTLSSQYNFLKRADYGRHLSNLSLKYEWNEGSYKKHEFHLIDHNITVINKNSPILNEISKLSPSQRFKFEDHIIFGLRYAYYYNNELKPSVSHPTFFKGKIFLYGPSALIAKAFGKEARNSENAITLFSVRYATMLKLETDFRKHFNLGNLKKIAFRTFAGGSKPFDEGTVVPFDQLYFGGGPNSIRGWRQRTLGPGSYFVENDDLDKLGEIKLEVNLEYRFPYTELIRGAFFIDAGNIWALNDENEKANFRFNKFYEQFAVAVGTGVRLDFDFFVLRLDGGYPIKAPYLNKWFKEIYDGKVFNVSVVPQFHFGIGYPF